jgi:hypothetical protein
MIKKLTLPFLLTITFFACGSKPAPEIAVNLQFSGSNPFTNSNLSDIIFTLTDSGNPTQPLAFPSECATTNPPFAAHCGFLPSVSDFRLDPNPIPQEATMTLVVQGRDGSGTVLFSGTSAPFVNNVSAAPVNITVSAP